MKPFITLLLALVTAVTTLGCTANVETTEDSQKNEVETPKVEVGDKPVDLGPKTDKDVDVDTPAPGDT